MKENPSSRPKEDLLFLVCTGVVGRWSMQVIVTEPWSGSGAFDHGAFPGLNPFLAPSVDRYLSCGMLPEHRAWIPVLSG